MPLVGRSLAIYAVAIVMMIISIVTVSLRAFVRLYLVQAFGWDDGLMVVALVCSRVPNGPKDEVLTIGQALFVTLTAFCMIGSTNGIGHSILDFPSLEVYKKALLVSYELKYYLAYWLIASVLAQWWWLGQMLYLWASAVAKISITIALLRLTVKRVHRIILWANIGIVISIGLMFWLVLLLDCHPISYFWNRVDPRYSGTCLPVQILLDIAYLYSALTIICDLTLGILPIFLIWTLQMNRRTKIAVGGILSLGAMYVMILPFMGIARLTRTSASVAVIIRLPFLHYYADTDFLSELLNSPFFKLTIYQIRKTIANSS